jgi:predicted double-glycine peptidase
MTRLGGGLESAAVYFRTSMVTMLSKKQRASAFWRLIGMAGLSAAYLLFPLTDSFLKQQGHLMKQLRAWKMGACFVTDKDVVLQSSVNDCGPASLKMILSAHGINSSISDLSSELRLTPEGTSMLALRSISGRLGLPAKSWDVNPEDLSLVPLPAIAFVNTNHFVVLRRFVAPEMLEVDDPALGRLRWPTHKFIKIWSGETLIFDPAWTPL